MTNDRLDGSGEVWCCPEAAHLSTELEEMTQQRDALLGEVHDLRLALRQTMDELAEAGG